MDFFEGLLKELSSKLEVDLKPDQHQACRLLFHDTIDLQLEMDRSQEHLVVGAELGELLPGKFRETVLREALKANGEPQPIFGTLAFSTRKNQLILFEVFDIDKVNGAVLFDFLIPFTEKATLWKDGLQKGQTPPIRSSKITKGPELNIFNLKR